MLRSCPDGGYRYLPGIGAYSCGVVALPEHRVVHATLRAPVPYREGFARVERHLADLGRPRAALCAVELRLPAPLSFDGFARFNEGYRALLADWKLLIGGDNPIARTNVAPVVRPPAEPALYGFAYTVPGTTSRPTFVVAGSGELRDGPMEPSGIVRRGESSPEAMRDKAAFVMEVMGARLRGLGADWPDVTAMQVYTPYPVHAYLAGTVLAPAGAAAAHGIRWFLSRPPIEGLDYEMDMRGTELDVVL
jgi:hypothetical protein